MIILDENVHGQSMTASIATWYRGQVRSITTLRPYTLVKDEAIPVLLRRARQPTFVTTNVVDFWRRIPAHSRYSIVCVVLSSERLHELPHLLPLVPDLKSALQSLKPCTLVQVGM